MNLGCILERKYARKTTLKPTIEAHGQTQVATTPAPAATAPASPPPSEALQSAKPANGLSPPPSAGVESGVSDNEGSVASPTSPQTPSKSVSILVTCLYVHCSFIVCSPRNRRSESSHTVSLIPSLMFVVAIWRMVECDIHSCLSRLYRAE